MDQSFSEFFFDMRNSEVAEALLGFLVEDPPSLLCLDSIFDEQDIAAVAAAATQIPSDQAIILLPSPKCCHINNNSNVCSDYNIIIQDQIQPPLLDQPSFFYPSMAPPESAGADCGGNTLSVQTVAARERRRSISYKTLEFGRLIPGGANLSTADMLQSGCKHIKFLEAQIVVLNHMPASIPESKRMVIEVLLASPVIQERLSAQEMCLVPSEMID